MLTAMMLDISNHGGKKCVGWSQLKSVALFKSSFCCFCFALIPMGMVAVVKIWTTIACAHVFGAVPHGSGLLIHYSFGHGNVHGCIWDVILNVFL